MPIKTISFKSWNLKFQRRWKMVGKFNEKAGLSKKWSFMWLDILEKSSFFDLWGSLILSWFRLHFDRKVSWSADTFESWKIRGVFSCVLCVQYAKRETWECVLITSEHAKKMQSCFSKHGVQFCIAWWADLLKKEGGRRGIRLGFDHSFRRSLRQEPRGFVSN